MTDPLPPMKLTDGSSPEGPKPPIDAEALAKAIREQEGFPAALPDRFGR